MADEHSITPGTPLSADQNQSISKAFDFLYSGLREAHRRFHIEGNDRDGAIHALETIIKFLSLCEPVQKEALNAPLVVLFDALMSLDDGDTQPILQKIKYPGRPPASAGRECFKGAVTFTVHGLRATGVALENAREQVAGLLNAEGVAVERGRFTEITPRTIHGWEEAVAEDVGCHGEAAQTYDLMKQEFNSVADACPAMARNILLKRLGHVIHEMHQHQKAKNPVNPPI